MNYKLGANNPSCTRLDIPDDSNADYLCEVDGGKKFKLVGKHWFGLDLDLDKVWRKVMTDCVPKYAIIDYDKFISEEKLIQEEVDIYNLIHGIDRV